MAAQQPPPPPGHQRGARVGDHQPLTVGGRAARGAADNGNVNAARAAAPAVHQPNIQARGAAGARGVADNGNVNAARAAAQAVHQPNIQARGAAGARGVADNGNVNAARAPAPAVHQPNMQARGAAGVHIHRPMPPEAVFELPQEFLSSVPDVSRSSLADLGLPAYRWPSVN